MFGVGSTENNILNIIKNDEKHQIGKKTISGYDLLALSYQKYLEDESYLNPLIEALSSQMNITNISFNSDEDGFSVIIEYFMNNSRGVLLLKKEELVDNLEFVLDSSNGLYRDIILKNKKLITDSFENSHNKSLIINQFNSTSKLFEMALAYNKYQIIYHNIHNIEDYFKLSLEYNLENRDGDTEKILKYIVCNTSLSKIEDYFRDLDNVRSFLNHVRVYDSDVQKVLVKK